MNPVQHNTGGSFAIGEDGTHNLVERTKDRHDSDSIESAERTDQVPETLAAPISTDEVPQAAVKSKKAS